MTFSAHQSSPARHTRQCERVRRAAPPAWGRPASRGPLRAPRARRGFHPVRPDKRDKRQGPPEKVPPAALAALAGPVRANRPARSLRRRRTLPQSQALPGLGRSLRRPGGAAVVQPAPGTPPSPAHESRQLASARLDGAAVAGDSRFRRGCGRLPVLQPGRAEVTPVQTTGAGPLIHPGGAPG